MRIGMKSLLTVLLVLGFAPLGLAVDFVDYHIDGCDDYVGTDAEEFYLQCVNGACIASALLCDTREDKAKYRVHFDTAEEYYDENEECYSTAEHTTMYRPGSDKLTGPEIHSFVDGGDFLQWIFMYDALGVEPGDYVAAWLDVHHQGIQDRVPDTDGSDGCEQPQYSNEVLGVFAAP